MMCVMAVLNVWKLVLRFAESSALASRFLNHSMILAAISSLAQASSRDNTALNQSVQCFLSLALNSFGGSRTTATDFELVRVVEKYEGGVSS